MKNMNIYLINMDKDVDRFNKFKKSADIYDINFTRVSGVLIKDEYIKNSPTISNFMKTYGTKGMIGCFLAHKKVWEIVVKDKMDYAVILEDDIEFTSIFKPTLKQIQNDNIEFDILLLSSLLGCKNPKNYNWLDNVSKHFFKKRLYQYINEKYHIPEFFAGAQSYIITYESAKKLLKELSMVTYHIDTVLSNSHHIKILSLNQPIIKLSVENSDLSNNSTSQYFLDRYFKNIFVDGKNLSWLLNISLLQIPFPYKSMIVNVRFIIKILVLFIVIIICMCVKLKKKYWIPLIILFLLFMLL